jgi:signal transduction histidine kinase
LRVAEGGSTDDGRATDAAALEEYRTAIRDTTRLNRLFAILSDVAPIPVLVDRVLIALSEMFAADVVALLRPDGGGDFATAGAIGLPEELAGRRFSGRETGCAAAAVRSRAPILVDHAMDDPGMDAILTELEIQTAAWLPVLGTREVMGVLVVGRGQPLPFSRVDTDLMFTMMNRIGLVLERARAEEDRAHVEARLRQAEKAESLSRMAAAIAHQLNNKLTGVMGSLELALQELAAGRDPRVDIGTAQEAARQASLIGLQMLAYLGLGSRGRVALDLVDICKHTVREVEPSLRAGVRLRAVLPDRELTISGSSADIRQMLMNLITNAVEATSGDGEIVVTVREVAAGEMLRSSLLHLAWTPDQNTYACLEVSDSGHGMDPEVLRNAFDPFFTTRFTGRGLGLPVVQGVVRAHDGTLELQSKPGAGTTVRVFLPLLEGHETRPS